MLDLAAVALALSRYGAVTATPERLDLVAPELPAADGSTIALWRDGTRDDIVRACVESTDLRAAGGWWCLRVVHSYGRASRLDAAVLAVAYQCRLRGERVRHLREAALWRGIGAALELVTESHDEATPPPRREKGRAGGARE